MEEGAKRLYPYSCFRIYWVIGNGMTQELEVDAYLMCCGKAQQLRSTDMECLLEYAQRPVNGRPVDVFQH
jgi:hypothetical protein